MITCDRVDLPDPLGPMTAWTSPERTTRSIPRRISLPSTPARRPSITSSDIAGPFGTVDLDEHLTVFDPGSVHRHGSGGREDIGLAGLQRERAAVLPALDVARLHVDLALGQRDVLVGADVADHVDVVADAHDGESVVADLEALGLAVGERLERGDGVGGQRRSSATRSSFSAMRWLTSAARAGAGSWRTTSSKKPATIRRSAVVGGTPRLS